MRMHSRVTLILVLTILSLGIFLRFWQYDSFPPEHESLDELAWTLQGASLLATGTPQSWSYFDYPNSVLVPMQGIEQRVVTPYLDHPPLFGLIPGSVQYLFGQTWSDLLPTAAIRLPVVLLAAGNVLLFWFLSRVLFAQRQWQFFSLALFATTPFVVFASRVIVAEQLLISLLLISLLCILQQKYEGWRNVTLLFVGAALVMTKVSGLVLGVGVVLLAWLLGKRVQSVWLLLGLVFGAIFYFVYASLYDLSLFLSIQNQQQVWRSSGLLSAFMGLVFKPELVNSAFFDGFLLTGVLAAFALLTQRLGIVWKGMVGLVGLFCVFVFYAAGETTINLLTGARGGSMYGWYWYPLLPIFVLLITKLIAVLYEQKQAAGLVAIFSVLTIPMFRLLYFIVFDSVPTAYMFPRMATIFIVMYLASLFLVLHKWRRAGMLLAIIVLMCAHLAVIYGMHPTLYWSEGQYWGQV